MITGRTAEALLDATGFRDLSKWDVEGGYPTLELEDGFVLTAMVGDDGVSYRLTRCGDIECSVSDHIGSLSLRGGTVSFGGQSSGVRIRIDGIDIPAYIEETERRLGVRYSEGRGPALLLPVRQSPSDAGSSTAFLDRGECVRLASLVLAWDEAALDRGREFYLGDRFSLSFGEAVLPWSPVPVDCLAVYGSSGGGVEVWIRGTTFCDGTTIGSEYESDMLAVTIGQDVVDEMDARNPAEANDTSAFAAMNPPPDYRVDLGEAAGRIRERMMEIARGRDSQGMTV